MQVYTVHYDPFSPDPDRDATVLREGFSWMAFLFTWVWALWNRLWIAAVAIIAISVAFELVGAFGLWDSITAFAVMLGFQIFVGLHGNDLKRLKLESKGYLLAGIVAAPNQDTALRRFFDLHPEAIGGRSGGASQGV